MIRDEHRARRTSIIEAMESRVLLSVSLVKDIVPGPLSSQPYDGVAAGNELSFFAADSATASGLYFFAPDPAVGNELIALNTAPQPLVIQGTSGDDVITVSVGAASTLMVNVNGTVTNYSPAQYASGITIETGAAVHQDTLNLNGLPAVPTTAFGEGLVVTTVGTAARALQDIAATTLTLGGGTGTVQATINDASDTTARRVTYNTDSASGPTFDVLHGLAAGDIHSFASKLVVNLGNAGNTLDINRTASVNPGVGQTVNLNTGNGNDMVTVQANPLNCVLNINGQSGSDEVSVSDAGRTVLGIHGPVNVSNPLGATHLTINDLGRTDIPGRQINTTLDAFGAPGARYGSLQGLALAPINFAAPNVDIYVECSGTDPTYLTVNNTPGGLIRFFDLAKATVLGTAPNQSLGLDASEYASPGDVIVDFSTGRIGDGSQIGAAGYADTIMGGSASDAFTFPQNGGLLHGNTLVNWDDFTLADLTLQHGTFTVDREFIGSPAYGITAVGAGTRLSFAVDESSDMAQQPFSVNDGAIAAIANGVTLNLPISIHNATLDVGTGQANRVTVDPGTTIRSQIVSGLSGGRGITSSAADARHGIGYFGSKVKYAWYGDANLDGSVDFADLLSVAQNYGSDNAVWTRGDFNYDGKVDFADLLKVGQNYAAPTAAVTSPLFKPALVKSRRVR